MNGGTKEQTPREFAPDDFYRAFAIAMLEWQAVEHNLCLLFHSLTQPPQVRTSGSVYYSLSSFGSKLRVVDSAAAVILQGNRLRQWTALKKELEAASKDRNVLAHLTAAGDFHEDGSLQLVLTPPLFVPAHLVRNRAKEPPINLRARQRGRCGLLVTTRMGRGFAGGPRRCGTGQWNDHWPVSRLAPHPAKPRRVPI